MESILNIFTFNITLNYIPHSAQLKSAIEEFLEDHSRVGFLTNSPESWKNIKFSFPITIKSFETNIKLPPLTGYILDLRHNEITENYLKLIPRNADTKYVAVILESDSKRILDSLISLSLCSVRVIILLKEKIEILTLNDRCRGIGESVLEIKGCKVNISFMDFPPYVIFNGKNLSGYEGKMLQTVADKMGLKLNYINRHDKEWGAFDPPSGLLGDVGSKTSFAGFGAIYAYQNRYIYTDFLFGCSTVELSWAVSVGAGQSAPTWFLILISEFSPEVWMCIIITYFLLVIMSNLFNLKTKYKTSWALHNLGLVLGASQKKIQPKIFTISIVWFGMVGTFCYQTMMGTKLTLPPKIPEMNDLQTLSDSGLLLYGPPTTKAVISAAASNGGAAYEYINKSYIPSTADLDELLPRIERKEIAYLRHRSNLRLLVDRNPKFAGKIHFVKESMMTYIPVTMIRKHSCLLRNFQKAYSRLCDSGLGEKWYRDMTKVYHKPVKEGPKKLAFSHIQGFLILLSTGLIWATLFFIAELIFNFFNKNCKKLKDFSKMPDNC